MGVNEDAHRYEETTKALEHSSEYLKIHDYIQVVGYEIDEVMFDQLWQCISEDRCTPMGAAILEWMGYDPAQERNNQAKFKNLLKSHKIQYREIKHIDPEFTEYPELVKEAKSYSIEALSSKKWIIMDSEDFKDMVMYLRTKKATAIHVYYRSVEKLFRMHCEYTSYFMKRQAETLLNEKNQIIEEKDKQNNSLKDEVQTTHVKLNVSRDIVVPPIPQNPRLMNWCGIIEMAPSFIPCETDPGYIQEHKPHVIIVRFQRKKFGWRFNKIKAFGNKTNEKAEMNVKFPSSNAINLNLRLKEKLKGTPYRFFGGYGVVIDPGGSVEELIEIVKKIHEERLHYAEYTCYHTYDFNTVWY